MDSVKGALLKAYYPFGNSQKTFCAWVLESLYIKFAVFFSTVEVNLIYIVVLSTNKHKLKVKKGALLCSFIQWVKAVDSFREKLDLRCLTAFLIRLYVSLHSGWGTYSLEILALTVTQSNERTSNGIHGCYKSQSLI